MSTASALLTVVVLTPGTSISDNLSTSASIFAENQFLSSGARQEISQGQRIPSLRSNAPPDYRISEVTELTSGKTYQASNLAHQLDVIFEATGVQVKSLSKPSHPYNQEWQIVMRPISYGYDDYILELSSPDINVDKNRIEYRSAPGSLKS